MTVDDEIIRGIRERAASGLYGGDTRMRGFGEDVPSEISTLVNDGTVAQIAEAISGMLREIEGFTAEVTVHRGEFTMLFGVTLTPEGHSKVEFSARGK